MLTVGTGEEPSSRASTCITRKSSPTLHPSARHMANSQGKYISRLTSREIESSHWMLAENYVKLIDILGEWIEKENILLGQGQGQKFKL